MLNQGEYAVYGMNGVCRVSGTEERDGKLFYLLEPVSDPALKIFIPVTNAAVRSPIGKDEAFRLLESVDAMTDVWVNDNRDRRRIFSDIMSKYELSDMLRLAKSIYLKKCERRAMGKSMYSYEDNQLRTAEKAVCGELAFALDITSEKAAELLEERFLHSA
ncbi:MAG: CarD family transcriptional regulator [Oscillospiraceae bacterium]|nr:CarD family transcriptional regulator [Oscillospiraceae bacterium]